jgi:hypothetical protein
MTSLGDLEVSANSLTGENFTWNASRLVSSDYVASHIRPYNAADEAKA